MIDIMTSNENGVLTPNQISVIILANGKLTETETHFNLTVTVGEEDNQLSWSVLKEQVPGLDKEEIKRLLGDTILRQYQVVYNSSRRLKYDQSSEKTSESPSQSES